MRATGLGLYWFQLSCQHGSRQVYLPRPFLRRESLSPPANSLLTPLLEAKTERFAAHPSRVTHETVCPGPPARHSYPFKTHSFRAPTSGLAQRNFKQGAGRSPTTLDTPCVLAPCLTSSAVCRMRHTSRRKQKAIELSDRNVRLLQKRIHD